MGLNDMIEFMKGMLDTPRRVIHIKDDVALVFGNSEDIKDETGKLELEDIARVVDGRAGQEGYLSGPGDRLAWVVLVKRDPEDGSEGREVRGGNVVPLTPPPKPGPPEGGQRRARAGTK